MSAGENSIVWTEQSTPAIQEGHYYLNICTLL
jgi:hypothetical protein